MTEAAGHEVILSARLTKTDWTPGGDDASPESRGHSLRGVINRFGVLAFAALAGQAIGFLVLAVVARKLGAANLGQWYLAVSILAYFSLPVGLGMTTLGTRDIATDPASGPRVIGEVVLTQAVLAAIMFAILVFTSPTIAGASHVLRVILVISGVTLFYNAVTVEWALQAAGRAPWLAGSRLAGQVVYGAVGLLWITAGTTGIERYAICNMIGVTVTAVISWLAVLRFVGVPRVEISPRRQWARLVRSVPFGMTLVMVQVYWALGIVLLAHLGTAREVGLYGVAQRVPQVVITLTLMWVATVFPHAAAVYSERPDLVARQLRRVVGAGLSVLPPFILVAPFVGTAFMAALFGPGYVAAGRPFTWLMLLAAVTFISVNFTAVLLAIGGERRFVWYAVVAAGVSLCVTIFLIPRLGAVAPAIGTLAAECTVAGFTVRQLRLRLGKMSPIMIAVPKLALGAAGCLGVLLAATSLWWPARAALAIAAYFGASGIVSLRSGRLRVALQPPVRPRLPGIHRPKRRTLTTVTAAVLGLVGCGGAGYLSARGASVPCIAVAAALLVTWALWRHLTYVAPALCLLAATNGFPGLDLSSLSVPGVATSADAFASFALLIAASRLHLYIRRTKWQVFLMLWGTSFVLYWCLIFIRTVGGGTSTQHAFSTGRDFLFFGLIVPVAHRLFRSRDAALRFCAVVGVLTAVYSAFVVLAAVHLVPIGLVNVDHVTRVGSFTRIYTFMNALIALVFMFSLAWTITKEAASRRYARAVAVVTGLATVILLTRAVYYGVAIGLVAVVLVWFWRPATVAVKARRRILRGVAIGALAVGVVASAAPKLSSSPAVATLLTRAASGFSELSGSGAAQTNTVVYRQAVDRTLRWYVGNQWVLGLGFQHPADRYYAGLPGGGLRNPDLGVANQLATLGLIGALLFFVPVFGLGVYAVARSRSRISRDDDWFWIGSTAWVTYVFATILTLGLSNIEWDLMAGIVLGLAGRLGTLDGPEVDTRQPKIRTRPATSYRAGSAT